MKWILEHLQLVIAAAGALAWWLNQRKQAQAAQENEPPQEATFEDPELAERTRRIREEIQRKIEQRARPAAPHDRREEVREAVTPPPIMQAPRRHAEAPPITRATSASAHFDAQRTAEILEQQAALAERLRQAGEMKAAALRRAQYEQRIAGDGEQTAAAARAALSDDLRDPAALRRAFVLREIIGPPVALR